MQILEGLNPQQEKAARKQRNKESQMEVYAQPKAPKDAGNGSLGDSATLRNQQVVCSSHITSSSPPPQIRRSLRI